jgi:hypothetical protein
MQYRITIYMAGREVVGVWLPYHPDVLLMQCRAYAENMTMFTVEFE